MIVLYDNEALPFLIYCDILAKYIKKKNISKGCKKYKQNRLNNLFLLSWSCIIHSAFITKKKQQKKQRTIVRL
jgi:hypothetical protein